MWHRRLPPYESLIKRLFPPPHPRAQEWVRRLDYYPGWRQCQYLALNSPSGYISGLTAYMDHTLEHLTGIVAHGHSNLALGSPNGVEIHLPLKAGEHLTSAWLHVRGYYYGVLNCFSVSRYLFLHLLLTDWTPTQVYDKSRASTSLRQLQGRSTALLQASASRL